MESRPRRSRSLLALRQSGTLSDEEVHWLRSSKAFFLADPCWISEAERLIAAECFHYRRRIGQIILVRESGSRAVSIRTIRASEFHHSFPMVYTFNDACLIIPESAAANQVCAISINSNGKVISEIAILTGCQLVDPIVFCHDGSYWMFANPLHNFDNELVVFRGDSAVGPWHATALWFLPIPNCRGAGRIFEQDGVLYWPTQFNTRRYGGGVILRRIVSLTATQLNHEIVSVIRPDPKGSRPLGFHTVNKGEHQYLVDGLAYRFSPLKPLYVLAARMRRKLRRSERRKKEASTHVGPHEK